MLGTGMVLIGVPLSVGYAFHCLRGASDRGLAVIAFGLSLVSLVALSVWLWRLAL
jgi:hypothetical protein